MMKKIVVITMAMSISLSIGSLMASQSSQSNSATKPTKSSHGNVHWSYANDNGPNAWGGMSEDHHTCKAGKNQSPVDIRNAVDRGLDQLGFHYSPITLAIINNGHTIQVNYSGDSYLIHQAKDGRLAVVGVMIKRGDKNHSLQKDWDHLPSSIGNVNHYGSVIINAASLLPDSKSYLHYNGSLTTPSCSEGVNWFVLKYPVQISPEQVKSFRNLVENNARVIQSVT